MTSVSHCSTTTPVRILVAEDEPEIRDYLKLALRRPNFVIDFAENGEEVINTLSGPADLPALLILDIMMPRKDGIETLRDIRQRNQQLPIIMLSGISGTSDVVEAMRIGANDFLTKPVSADKLWKAVDLQLPQPFLPVEPNLVLKTELSFAASEWSKKIEPLLSRMASSDVPILLQGETGVGKEVLARQIHDQSLRAGEVFLKLNCAALPSELVESELFGYERGAFTGAFRNNPGKFELAHGGTIFLDEIGDMDLKLQAKLLQVLQDREFHKLGAKEATQVDVRVIAATHRDLEAQIEKGEFREDLYYRLNVVSIQIPPLRERSDETLRLASFFLKKHNQDMSPVPEIGKSLSAALLRYPWPGNIRELENTMRSYLVIRSPQAVIDELDRRLARQGQSRSARAKTHPSAELTSPETALTGITPANGDESAVQSMGSPTSDWNYSNDSELTRLNRTRQEAERELILNALHSAQWNRKRAAAALGAEYKAFLYKMKKLGITSS